jgi:imidazolonepropionase-like amidohydrolase
MYRLLLLILSFSYLSMTEAETYAIIAPRIIDGNANTVLENQAILVMDAEISAIIEISQIPQNAVRINLPDTTLMPGMINAHEHPLLYKHDYQNAHLQGSSAY